MDRQTFFWSPNLLGVLSLDDESENSVALLPHL